MRNWIRYHPRQKRLNIFETTLDEQTLCEYDPLPSTRSDCLPGGRNEQRPCPYVSCRHHLRVEVNRAASSVFEHSNWTEPTLSGGSHEYLPTCTLDLADQGPMNLEQIAQVFNVTRERVRQIEEKALKKLNQFERQLVLKECKDYER